ncbi:MAG: hypothetical protein E7055_01735 [Lentisphaerae bacterium]|nr:hypothetical protein [Lentisphaerota bacterium]
MARPRPNPITAHIHAAVEKIDSVCDRARNDIRARLLDHIADHPNAPWSYVNVAKLERTLTAMYHQWGDSINAQFDHFLPQEYQAGYDRAKADLTRSGVWQNVLGGPDTRRIQNALDSVYNNVALRTDKMSFDHIRQLRNFSAKVFREAAITGETRRQVSERLENEALQVPGFQFTDIAGRKWSHKSYFEMLARTELMNGARDSYEQECAEQGYNIMLLSVSGHCCEACAKYEGQYFSIGPNKYGLPTKDDLEAAGVFHPNCTHSYSAVPDYIIEKEFGKSQEKTSRPTGPSGPSSPSGLTLPNNSTGQSMTGSYASANRQQSLGVYESKQTADHLDNDLRDKIIDTKITRLTDDALGKINSVSVKEYPDEIGGEADRNGNICLSKGTAFHLNAAYAKAKTGKNDFSHDELHAIEVIIHEINHLRQSQGKEEEENIYVMYATEVANEEFTRRHLKREAAALGFNLSEEGVKYIQSNARGYRAQVSRLRNIADALGCRKKYQNFLCREVVKLPRDAKLNSITDFFLQEMKQQGLSPDFELFTNDFFDNEKELVQWINRNRH